MNSDDQRHTSTAAQNRASMARALLPRDTTVKRMSKQAVVSIGAARRQLGFTLIELMIVVAIVGVLAALGIVSYRKIVLAAHTTEATHMVQSIRTAEESYHAEAQVYLATMTTSALSGCLTTPTGLYPNSTPSNAVTVWAPTGTCGSSPSNACFASLPVHTDGPVSYGYGTAAGSAGVDMGTMAVPVGAAISPGAPATDWYWVAAVGNPANNSAGPYSVVVGNSLASQLYVIDQ